MTPRTLLVAVLAVLASATACTTLLSTGEERQPPPADRLLLSHTVHADMDIECGDCHAAALAADDLTAKLRPDHDVCRDCHDDLFEDKLCTTCHSNVEAAGQRPPPSDYITVSHRKHVARTAADCLKCHTGLPEPDRRDSRAPTMARCLGCHNHQADYDAGRCRHCHPDLTRFRIQPVADFSHRGDFVRAHAQLARSTEACAGCHDQTFCASCHARTAPAPIELVFPERVDRAFIHRNDWLGRHMIEAGADPALCRRCHGEDFCQSCHTLQRLTPMSVDPRNPHPAGWLAPGSASSHGRAARRDVSSCASCHDRGPATNCIECHAVGRIGGNPHPAGWLTRHDVAEIGRNVMCRYCHL